MENGGYDESSAEDPPTIIPVVQSITTPPSIACRCEEEEVKCHCSHHKPPPSKPKIELQSASKKKNYILVGLVGAFVLWGAVYFTLLGLDYV